MMKVLSRIAAAALASCLILAGCSTDKKLDESAPQSSGAPASGRYREEEYAFPDGTAYVIYFDALPDQSVEFFGVVQNEYAFYTSADGGKTWAPKDAPWLGAIKAGTGIDAFARDPRGGYAFFGMTREQYEASESLGREDFHPFTLFRVDASGQITSREITQEDGLENEGYLEKFKIDDNGNLIIMTSYDKIGVYHPETLESLSAITLTDTDTASGLVARGDILYIAMGKEIKIYRLSTGEQSESIAVPGGFNENSDAVSMSSRVHHEPIAVSADGSAIYFCDRTGIYRKAADGPLLEQAADGALLSLSIPSMWVEGFVAKADGSFLIRYRGETPQLMNYQFDPTLAVEPERTLKVYAMEDNRTVRQAVGLFQRADPSVRVALDIGGGDAEMTASDILRSLNTELLAGKGPDILLLDNLPFSQYIEKGVLMDLSSLVQENTASGKWLDKAGALKNSGGGIYAIPARFAVPVLLSAADGVPDSLEGLADWVEKIRADQAENYRDAFYPKTPKALIRTFYPVCAPMLTQEGGEADTAAIERFLTDITRLVDAADPEKIAEETDGQAVDETIAFSALSWKNQAYPATAEQVISMNSTVSALYALGSAGGGINPLPGMVSNVFVPSALLGVNANGNQVDTALSFIETVLSDEVQSVETGDGLPISTKAFNTLYSEPGGEGAFRMGAATDNTLSGETIVELLLWPGDEAVKTFWDRVKALDQPVVRDNMLIQLIQEESASFFRGDRSVQEAAQAIKEKMNLRLSE